MVIRVLCNQNVSLKECSFWRHFKSFIRRVLNGIFHSWRISFRNGQTLKGRILPYWGKSYSLKPGHCLELSLKWEWQSCFFSKASLHLKRENFQQLIIAYIHVFLSAYKVCQPAEYKDREWRRRFGLFSFCDYHLWLQLLFTWQRYVRYVIHSVRGQFVWAGAWWKIRLWL